MRNWREYESGLRNRGSLTVWISLTRRQACELGRAPAKEEETGPSTQVLEPRHRDGCHPGMVFHLSSRQSEGLLRSLFALMSETMMCPITHALEAQAEAGVRSLLPSQAEDAVAHLDRQQRSRCPRRPAAQSTKEQGLSQAPSVCRRAEWRSRRRRADEQKSPRFIAGCIACRTERQSHLIGQS